LTGIDAYNDRKHSHYTKEEIIMEPQIVGDEEYEKLSGATPQRKRRSGKLVVFALLGLLFAGGVSYGTYTVLDLMRANVDSSSSAKTVQSGVKSTTAVSSTSTDTTIANSLSGIDSSMTQATTDQSNADVAPSLPSRPPNRQS
jgi:hypothetical protein